MPINKIVTSNSILQPLALQRNSITTVFQPDTNLLGTDFSPGYKIIGINYFNFNLYASAQIKSLPIVSLVGFVLKDPISFKEINRKNYEIDKPRKRLSLLFQRGVDWNEVGFINLINLGNDFYDIHNLLEENNINSNVSLSGISVGVKITDVNHGLLSGDDKVLIYGSYNKELILLSSDPSPINNINITNSGLSSGGGTSDGGGSSGNGNNQQDNSILNNLAIMDNNTYLGN